MKLADGTIIGSKLDLATIEKEATDALQKGSSSEGDAPEEGDSLANILDANSTAEGGEEGGM